MALFPHAPACQICLTTIRQEDGDSAVDLVCKFCVLESAVGLHRLTVYGDTALSDPRRTMRRMWSNQCTQSLQVSAALRSGLSRSRALQIRSEWTSFSEQEPSLCVALRSEFGLPTPRYCQDSSGYIPLDPEAARSDPCRRCDRNTFFLCVGCGLRLCLPCNNEHICSHSLPAAGPPAPAPASAALMLRAPQDTVNRRAIRDSLRFSLARIRGDVELLAAHCHCGEPGVVACSLIDQHPDPVRQGWMCTHHAWAAGPPLICEHHCIRHPAGSHFHSSGSLPSVGTDHYARQS